MMDAASLAGLLKEYFSYDLETGVIRWKKGWGKTHAHAAGQQAFQSLNSHGYLNGKFCRMTLKAHRVAWLLHHGAWPDGQIDHINGDKTDNRLANLRVVSAAVNGRNRKLSANNRTGVNGVVYRKKYGNYAACLKVNRRRHHIGTFDTIELAAEAVRVASLQLGFHKNHGRLAALSPEAKTGE